MYALHDAQLLLALHGASHESVCPGHGSGTHWVPLSVVYLQTWLELQVIEASQMQCRPHVPFLHVDFASIAAQMVPHVPQFSESS